MEKVKRIEKKILKKIQEIIRNELIVQKDKVLIAFSGGPDSVFLYYFLEFLKAKLLLDISIIYINHNLRCDVDNDLEFVKKFAFEKNIDCYVESVDVKSYARKNKKSVELAARELRYEIIENVRKKIGYNKIATGHNLDDNVETFIFRILRGTSVIGLKSIPKVRENIVRPILEFEKKEILYFLKQKNLNYIIDYTNNENDYTRNFIRNKIFPDFEKINPNFRQKVYELIKEINDREFEKIGKVKKMEVSRNTDKIVEKEKEFLEKNLDKKDKLVEFLKENNVEISREKINQIFDSLYSKNGALKSDGSKEFDLGKNKFLQNQYGELRIVKNDSKNDIGIKKDENIDNSFDKTKILKKNQSIEWYNYKIIFYENISEFKNRFICEKGLNYTFFILSDDVKYEKIVIRSRKDGDRIFIKNLGHKKIKKILIDEKVPKWERNFLPIIEMEITKIFDTQNNLINNREAKLKKSEYKFKFENENNEIRNKKTKEILAVSDIKFSIFLEKIYKKNDTEKLENNTKLLIIGRKDGR